METMSMVNRMDNKYNMMVDERIANDSPEIFGNFSRENAKHIIQAFIRSAQQSVTILGGSMPDEFYTDLNSDASNGEKTGVGSSMSKSVFMSLAQAAGTLATTVQDDSTIPIRIIILDDDDEEFDAFVEETNRSLNKQIIKVIHAQYHGRLPLNHYLVVDHKRYRLEKPHDPFHGIYPDILQAEVCCNDPRKAKKIEKSFNAIWKKLCKDGTNNA